MTPNPLTPLVEQAQARAVERWRELAAQETAWKAAVNELRSDSVARTELLAAVHWVSQGDGPRDWDPETAERLLDKVLDGPPLVLEEG